MIEFIRTLHSIYLDVESFVDRLTVQAQSDGCRECISYRWFSRSYCYLVEPVVPIDGESLFFGLFCGVTYGLAECLEIDVGVVLRGIGFLDQFSGDVADVHMSK